MSMLSGILSQVMANARSKKGGSEQDTTKKMDPYAKTQLDTILKFYPNMGPKEKENALKRVRNLGFTELADMESENLGITSPQEAQREKENAIYNYALKQQSERIAPGEQAKAPVQQIQPPQPSQLTPVLPSTDPLSNNIPTSQQVPAQAPLPTQTLIRKGPRFKITKITKNADGDPIITFNNSGLDEEEYVDSLINSGAINQQQGKGMKVAMWKAKVADITSDIESILPKFDEHTGKYYTHITFNNGESRVVEATGETLTAKPEKGKPFINVENGSIQYFSDEVGSEIPEGFKAMKGDYTPQQIRALNTAMREGRLDPRRINSRTGYLFSELELDSPGTNFESISADILMKRRNVLAQTSTRAQTLNTANDLYQTHMEEIIALRKQINPKFLPQLGELRSWNRIQQWLKTETGDATTAKFRGKAMLLADALQRVFGSGQGGEWAFAAAVELINPTLSPDAFEARMRSHASDLTTMAESARSFGNNPVAGSDGDEEELIYPKGSDGTFPKGYIMPDGSTLQQDTKLFSDGKGGWMNEDAYNQLGGN